MQAAENPRPLEDDALITLSGWLREGVLSFDRNAGQYVLQGQDGPIAKGTLLYQLCADLAALEGDRSLQRRRVVMLAVKQTFMPAVRSVINAGESLSAFVRDAIRHEVERRRAEVAAVFLSLDEMEGFHDGPK